MVGPDEITRRDALRTLGAWAAGAAAGDTLAKAAAEQTATRPARRPNVVLFLTDDQGYGDVHSHGNDALETPVLDKLAADGARFERFYVSPGCMPTRASLLTGRYHQRSGGGGFSGIPNCIPRHEATIAAVLKTAGYTCGCFGKWNNGDVYPYHPNGMGFDEFYGFCGGHLQNIFDPYLERNGRPVRAKGYVTDLLTDAAIEFIRANRARPFFCYVPYNAVHWPHQVPEKYYRKYAERLKGKRVAKELPGTYGMVENVDENIGRVMKELDALKLAGDTLVIFLTDNGPDTGRYNAGMRGGKGSPYEGGCRVPCFIRWPGRIKPGRAIKPMAAHIDLLPTVAAACGIDKPKTPPPGGVNLLPLLAGAAADWPDRMLFEKGVARWRQWRHYGKGGLYDISADPGETRDVAAEHPDVVDRLDAAYQDWEAGNRQAAQGRPSEKHAFVGHPEAPLVFLNAHRAEVRDVNRPSITFDGWIAGWNHTRGEVSWDIEVVEAGRFEVAVMQTCPASAVGTEIRVHVGGAGVEGRFEKAHDPDLLAKRCFPKTNPEKDWAPLDLGVLELSKGQAVLTVRVTKAVGEPGIDLRGVRLTRVP